MKALGIDPGDARVGVAVSDALGFLAHPLETIALEKFPKPEVRIAELARRENAETVVIGLPLRMDGSEGTAAAKARALGEKLRPLVPGTTKLVFVDERLTTVQAQEHLRVAGKKGRAQKPLIDQAAAVLILQDWLDQQQGPESLLLPEPETS